MFVDTNLGTRSGVRIVCRLQWTGCSHLGTSVEQMAVVSLETTLRFVSVAGWLVSSPLPPTHTNSTTTTKQGGSTFSICFNYCKTPCLSCLQPRALWTTSLRDHLKADSVCVCVWVGGWVGGCVRACVRVCSILLIVCLSYNHSFVRLSFESGVYHENFVLYCNIWPIVYSFSFLLRVF